MAYDLDLTKEELSELRDLHLLTMKPIVYVVNVAENEMAGLDISKVRNVLGLPNHSRVVPISAKIEEELMQLPEADAEEFLKEYGLLEPGLNRLIREAYDTLGLQTYFTSGVKEVRAWTVRKGAAAPEAAGKIHTDFEKGFIRAEVTAYDDYIAHKGEKGAREAGKLHAPEKIATIISGREVPMLTIVIPMRSSETPNLLAIDLLALTTYADPSQRPKSPSRRNIMSIRKPFYFFIFVFANPLRL